MSASDGPGGRAERSPRRDPGGEHDPHFEEHGYTAEDEGGIGHGEEGFLAEDYPGHNALVHESEREREHRHAHTWTWPRSDAEERDVAGAGARTDRRIRDEIGLRILRAEPDLSCVTFAVLDGDVRMAGTVDSPEDRRVVEALARNVLGVREVQSRIVVRDDRDRRHV